MRANALSCIVFGLLFVLRPAEVATFSSSINPAPVWLILTVGIGLIVNGLDLIRASTQSRPGKLRIVYFSMADFAWAIISLVLMVANIWITSKAGIIAALIIGLMVTLFGALQLITWKRQQPC